MGELEKQAPTKLPCGALAYENFAIVPVGDGAQMDLPNGDLLWRMNFNGTSVRDSRLAVGIIQSYLYLVEDCSNKEALRRLRLLRVAARQLREARRAADG
jgi:hypothetical protein